MVQSAVDLSDEILIGRPYGGTGIMYNKFLGQLVTPIDTNNARITAVMLSLACGPVLLVSVYFSTDYGDNDSLDNFIETCAAILHQHMRILMLFNLLLLATLIVR